MVVGQGVEDSGVVFLGRCCGQSADVASQVTERRGSGLQGLGSRVWSFGVSASRVGYYGAWCLGPVLPWNTSRVSHVCGQPALAAW